MYIKNTNQLINNINSVIASNNKSPSKENLKKLEKMIDKDYTFLDQTGGRIMKDTLNILINNYQKEYEIKPNLLKKTYIDEIKHHTLRGGGRVMDKMVKNLDNDWITQWIHLVNRKDALIYNKQIIEDTYKKLKALIEQPDGTAESSLGSGEKVKYIAKFIMLRNSIDSLITTMKGPTVNEYMVEKKKIEIVHKANKLKLQTDQLAINTSRARSDTVAIDRSAINPSRRRSASAGTIASPSRSPRFRAISL